MDLWKGLDLKQRCVLACVGAGGKTSLLRSLVRCARSDGLQVLATTTTKMYFHQLKDLNPLVSADYGSGLRQIAGRLTEYGAAAWVAGIEGEKAVGLPPEWIDRMAACLPAVSILVEADGAQGRWLKAPAEHEPVVPLCVTDTVGILNLEAVGRPLAEEIVHRLPVVAKLLKKQKNQPVEWRDVALLATDERGIFKGSRGRKTLVLAGADRAQPELGARIASRLLLARSGIDRCITVKGFGDAMEIAEVYKL